MSSLIFWLVSNRVKELEIVYLTTELNIFQSILCVVGGRNIVMGGFMMFIITGLWLDDSLFKLNKSLICWDSLIRAMFRTSGLWFEILEKKVANLVKL